MYVDAAHWKRLSEEGTYSKPSRTTEVICDTFFTTTIMYEMRMPSSRVVQRYGAAEKLSNFPLVNVSFVGTPACSQSRWREVRSPAHRCRFQMPALSAHQRFEVGPNSECSFFWASSSLCGLGLHPLVLAMCENVVLSRAHLPLRTPHVVSTTGSPFARSGCRVPFSLVSKTTLPPQGRPPQAAPALRTAPWSRVFVGASGAARRRARRHRRRARAGSSSSRRDVGCGRCIG